MIASPTFCNKHLNLFFFAHSIGPRPPFSDQDRCGCILYICAGLGYLEACIFLGLAAQAYRPKPTPPPPARDTYFICHYSIRMASSYRERDPNSPWRAATPMSNFLALSPPQSVDLGASKKRRVFVVGKAGGQTVKSFSYLPYLHCLPISKPKNVQTTPPPLVMFVHAC